MQRTWQERLAIKLSGYTEAGWDKLDDQNQLHYRTMAEDAFDFVEGQFEGLGIVGVYIQRGEDGGWKIGQANVIELNGAGKYNATRPIRLDTGGNSSSLLGLLLETAKTVVAWRTNRL